MTVEFWQSPTASLGAGKHETLYNAKPKSFFRFNLVETSNQTESIEFLAAATECLKNKYEGRRLYSQTGENGDADHRDRARDDVLPTFESFNESGKKKKPLKAWEVFARMLMQVRR